MFNCSKIIRRLCRQHDACDLLRADENAGSANAAWEINTTVYGGNVNGTIHIGELTGTGSLTCWPNNVTYSVGALNTSSTFGGTVTQAAGSTALAKVWYTDADGDEFRFSILGD